MKIIFFQQSPQISIPRSTLTCLLKSWAECVPLLALGLARLLSVKASGYHEHVSEYGLHWNFFFSLAASKLIASALLMIMPVSWWVSYIMECSMPSTYIVQF